jgi:hypothetical protein
MHVLEHRETKMPRPESERHSSKELLDQLILFLFFTYVGQNLYDTVYNNKENKTPWLRIIKGVFFKYRKKGSQLC